MIVLVDGCLWKAGWLRKETFVLLGYRPVSQWRRSVKKAVASLGVIPLGIQQTFTSYCFRLCTGMVSESYTVVGARYATVIAALFAGTRFHLLLQVQSYMLPTPICWTSISWSMKTIFGLWGCRFVFLHVM